MTLAEGSQVTTSTVTAALEDARLADVLVVELSEDELTGDAGGRGNTGLGGGEGSLGCGRDEDDEDETEDMFDRNPGEKAAARERADTVEAVDEVGDGFLGRNGSVLSNVLLRLLRRLPPLLLLLPELLELRELLLGVPLVWLRMSLSVSLPPT